MASDSERRTPLRVLEVGCILPLGLDAAGCILEGFKENREVVGWWIRMKRGGTEESRKWTDKRETTTGG
eukprot:3813114-Rhodomonas_salina.2